MTIDVEKLFDPKYLLPVVLCGIGYLFWYLNKDVMKKAWESRLEKIETRPTWNRIERVFLITFWLATSAAVVWVFYVTDLPDVIKSRDVAHPFGPKISRFFDTLGLLLPNHFGIVAAVVVFETKNGTFKNGGASPLAELLVGFYPYLPTTSLLSLFFVGYAFIVDPTLVTSRPVHQFDMTTAVWFLTATPTFAFLWAVALALAVICFRSIWRVAGRMP